MKERIIYIVTLASIVLSLCLPELCYHAAWNESPVWRIWVTMLFAFLPSFSVLAIPNTNIRFVSTILLWFISFFELLMVDTFFAYLTSGQLLAIVCANKSEIIMFFTYLWYRRSIWWLISLICLGVALVGVRTKHQIRVSLIGIVTATLICAATIGLSNLRLREFFPYDLLHETGVLISELKDIQHMKNDAASFSYGATQTEQNTENSIYVLAIGESLRYKNFALNGTYTRQTTPELSKLENLALYSNCYASATLTQHALPLMLSMATPNTYNNHFKEARIGRAFSETGYTSYFISNDKQVTNDGWHGYLVEQFDSIIYVPHDSLVVKELGKISQIEGRRFVTLHFQGNHFFYANRTEDCGVWEPDFVDAPYTDSDSLYLNAYDNCVLYTDRILAKCFNIIDSVVGVGCMLFLPDHGDYVDERIAVHGHTFHPTKEEYHIPLLIGYNEPYRKTHTQKVSNALKHKDDPICSDHVFWSVLDMAGVEIDEELQQEGMSIFGDTLRPHRRELLLPDGRSIMNLN